MAAPESSALDAIAEIEASLVAPTEQSEEPAKLDEGQTTAAEGEVEDRMTQSQPSSSKETAAAPTKKPASLVAPEYMPIDKLSKYCMMECPKSLYAKLGIDDIEDKLGMSEERIKDALPELRKAFSFYREYPDLFFELFVDPSSKFEFYFYQRVFLRECARNRYLYATFPRAYSKSFLSVLALYFKCIMYPGSKQFVVSGTLAQAIKISTEKLEEIWKWFPALKNELIWGTGPSASKLQKDYIRLMFKNGSIYDIVAPRGSTRGGRRTGGLIEEVILVDGKTMGEVILPLMNISRRAANGQVDPDDITNKSQIYITTAGYKNTFAYDKLIQILLWSVMRPDEAAIIGGTWRVPVANKMLEKTFLQDMKNDGTFSQESFDREYESIWTGAVEGAYYNPADFDRLRILEKPLDHVFGESIRQIKGTKIILSYDVGRLSDNSSLMVFRIIPERNGTYIKKLVNIFAMENMHFRDQARFIKRKILDYQADKLIIDANGLGVGLIDFLTIPTLIDPALDEGSPDATFYPALGIDRESDPDKKYAKYYLDNDRTIYMIKASNTLNSEMHKLVNTQMASGKIRFLIDDKTAKTKLLATKEGREMSDAERTEYLQPFVLTNLLRDEMMNLRRQNDDTSEVNLKRISMSAKKDKFSAFEYGLYYIRSLELKKKNKLPPISVELRLTSNNHAKGKSAVLDEFRQKRRTGGLGRGSSKQRRT